MDTQKKIKELEQKREEYKLKLEGMWKNFRGVKHEDSVSEIRYSQIRVYEDFVNSITEEINRLKLG